MAAGYGTSVGFVYFNFFRMAYDVYSLTSAKEANRVLWNAL